MDPNLVTILLNVVLIAMLVFGFLIGLRGLKKATSSLFTFLITMVVVIFLAGPVSSWVLSWQFGGRSLETIMNDAISSAFGSSLASSELAQNLAKGIPTMLVSIVVCIVLILIIGAIFKIIGNIIYKLIFGKEDKKVVEEVQIVNDVPQMTKKTIKPKKHRLLGGLVGFVHGALLAIVMFMPLVGVVNIVNDIAGTNEVSAEEYVANKYMNVDNGNVILLADEAGENSSFELKPAKELLKEYLPTEFYTYAKALDNSIIAKIGKIGNMSETSLNIIARCDINGETIKLGKELRQIAKVYDEFVEFATEASQRLGTTDASVIFNDIIENPNDYNFEQLYTLCDDMFESNLVKALSNDFLKAVADALVAQNPNSEYQPIFVHFQTAVDNYIANGYNLKDDVKAVLGAFEISAKSGLIKECKKEPFDIDNVCAVLLNDATDGRVKDEVLSNLSGKIASSNLLQKIVIEATNYGATYLQDVMNENITFNGEEKVVLPKIDGSKDIRVTSSDLTKVISGGVKVYKDVYDVIDFDAVNDDFYNIFDYELPSMLNIIGDELDVVLSMQLFKDSGLFASVCDAMNNSEYSKYLSFKELAKGSNLKTQMATLATSVDEIKKSNLVPILKSIDDDTNRDQKIDEVIDELSTKDIQNVSLSTKILKPLFSCSILKNTIIFGLDNAHVVMEESLSTLLEGKDAVISDFNTSTIMSDTDRDQILDIVNNFIAYVKDISIADLKGDKLMDTLIDSNLTVLGKTLDCVKTSNLFSSNGNGSAYNDIIDTLNKSSLNKTLDFSYTKAETFSWETEMSALQTTITTLNTIKVPTADGEKGLVSFLLNGGDFNDAYDVLTSENVMGVKPIFEISVVKPIAISVVNTINSKIKEFVGEDLGANITDIDKSVDLKPQALQITEVISAAIEIDLTEDDLDNVDKTKLNILLAKLEANAENDGVFKESYNALLLKTADMILENVKSFVDPTSEGADKPKEGKNITSITNVITLSKTERENIVTVLNTALDTVKELKGTTLEDLDLDKLFTLLEILKTKDISTNVFKTSYNAILLYIVNTVNDKIVEYIDNSVLTAEVVGYDGDVQVTSSESDIVKLIIKRAKSAFMAIPEGGKLEDIDNETLDEFLDILPLTKYTKASYNALNIKLANLVIENINAVTGGSIQTIATLQNLSDQADDIRQVVHKALDVAPSLKGKDLKLSEMSTEDKNNMVSLLTVMQNNKSKTNSVFKDSYESLVDYVATQNGITSSDIYDNADYTTNGVVDWAKFVGEFGA